MAAKKKTVQKKIKDTIPVPITGIVEASKATEAVSDVVTLFNFKSRFGNIVFSSPLNCDENTMNDLVKDYKRTHDLKDLTTVSVAPFIKWAVEDRGFSVGDTDKSDIMWA